MCHLHEYVQSEKLHNEGKISATGKDLKYPSNSVVVYCALCVFHGILCSVCVPYFLTNVVFVLCDVCL